MLALNSLWSGLLRGVSVEFPVGYHVVIGRPEDGLEDLAECLAGVRQSKPRSVELNGVDPFRSAGARASIGSVLPNEPELPRGNIERLLTQRLPKHSDAKARELLATCNLLERKAHGLSPEERRSLAFLMATCVPRKLIVAYEPFTHLPGLHTQAVMTRLAHQAERGACVVALTSNPAHAQYIEARGWLLDRGRLLELDGDYAVQLGPHQLLLECEQSRRLARALLEVGGLGVSYTAERPNQLLVTGPAERASLAAMHAATELGLDITRITALTPTVDQLRARAAGMAPLPLCRSLHPCARGSETQSLIRAARAAFGADRAALRPSPHAFLAVNGALTVT